MVLAGVAAALAGARDTGTGILAAGGGRAARTTGLASAMGLAARLAQGPALAWATGMAVTGMLVGLVARTAADAMADATGGTDVLAGLGIEEAGTRAYVAVSFLFITVALAVAAAGQVAATREEEASGRADMMMVRPVSRPTWLAGRVVVSLALLALAASAACLGTLVAGRAGGLGLATSDVVIAATNTLPAAVFVLGLGTLLHGVLPRLAATVTYALVAVSFLLEVVGSTVGVPGWVLGLSVLHHVAPAPAVSPDWGSAAVIVGIGVLCAGLGMLALERRDLTTA
jgi:ABC-2 type transport system permease protein